jgi:glutamine synthetase
MDRQQEYVLRTVEERGVRFVRLWFTDVLGQLKSLEITPVELEGALEDGMTFDGSAVDGFSRLQEADMIAVPDASTFELLPWRTDDLATARIFCDITRFDGSPFEGCPRQVLRRGLQRARDAGYTFFVGPDVEWFYFESADAPPRPLDRGSFFDLTATDVSSELRKSTTLACEAMGIPVRYSHHEDSPGQQEIDLRYTDALSMADNLMTFKLLVKEIAHQRGAHASFMPKPLPGVQGSGMHLNLSMFAGDENAFYDPDDEYQLSPVGRSFLAGLLVHAREITAVTNQWINSYKRLVSGFEAPTFVAWAHNNGSAMTRVPTRRTGKAAASRVEYRAADPACNPYLAFSVLLAAGLAGVREGYELGPELTENLYEVSAAERAQRSIIELPSSMGEALAEMENSALVAEALGEHVFEWFVRNKRAEWQEYRREVTPFELQRYLPLL